MNPQVKFRNAPFEVLHVESKKVSCDGGSGSLGHPLIYLDMGKKDFVACPYCSKFFTTKKKDGSNSVIIGIKNQMKSEE